MSKTILNNKTNLLHLSPDVFIEKIPFKNPDISTLQSINMI